MPVPDRSSSVARLLEAYADGHVTRLEVARRVERWARRPDETWLPQRLWDRLEELFPPLGQQPPDRDVVRLLACVLAEAEPELLQPLMDLALRRPLLAAVSRPGATVPDDILRPGERVLLGTARGREALGALLDGRVAPVSAWLRRTVLDPDAFVATTWDVPLADTIGLAGLVDRLATATETLPPGPVRAQVAREWISELSAGSLVDDVPFSEVVRCVGLRILTHKAPVLLWHAAQQLALVIDDHPLVAKALIRRCLPVVEVEAGLSPAVAAAPFLRALTVRQAAALLDNLAPDLPAAAWAVVADEFFAPAFRRNWRSWRPHVRRWATADDTARSLAVLTA
ncbi:MAG: hypothetical protein AVDCRST_MAG79-2741, partial [uncultured Thermoleophilia bacterium]